MRIHPPGHRLSKVLHEETVCVPGESHKLLGRWTLVGSSERMESGLQQHVDGLCLGLSSFTVAVHADWNVQRCPGKRNPPVDGDYLTGFHGTAPL